MGCIDDRSASVVVPEEAVFGNEANDRETNRKIDRKLQFINPQRVIRGVWRTEQNSGRWPRNDDDRARIVRLGVVVFYQ